ncbi:chitobiase/beta-hexosaminidase C-terminal domain-containing protein [Pelagicoccus mobilis]|uniref:chitobiase/beta-hexosaminidase C-terminal domain-containing protein n=1 Tax=Pelagicoccus mobilis TaxID=415221 RepID=UPI001902E03F|nr:chitobiase/beta-hexosaminidase C-terminal domain-containing protein [Pelagicoccus mobilis]
MFALLLAQRCIAQDRLAAPTISPYASKLYGPTEITLSTETSDASIVYTLETGGVISALKTYTGPFQISESTTVRALTRKSGLADSAPQSKRYEVVTTLDTWGLSETTGFGASPQNYSYSETYGNGVTVLQNDGTVLDLSDSNNHRPPNDLNDAIAIAAGDSYSIALKEDGTLVSWGEAPYGSGHAVPSNLPSAAAVAAGRYSASIITSDNRIVSWGGTALNHNNQPPRNIANVIAISEGEDYCLGILRDGTLAAWRNRDFTHTAYIPEGLNNVIAVRAGNQHNLALKADGTVVAWGDHGNEQSQGVSSWSDIVAISTSYSHSHGLKSDGTILSYPDAQTEIPNPELKDVVAFHTQHYSGTAVRSSPLDQFHLTLTWDEAKGHVHRSLHKDRFKSNEPVQLLAVPRPGYGFSHWSGAVDSTSNPLNLRVSAATQVQAVFLPSLATPTTDFDTDASSYKSATISLETEDAHAQIHYTLDGTEPTSQSPIYTSPIESTQSLLLRARAFAQGYAPSMELIIPVDVANMLGFGTSSLLDFPADATNVVSVACGRSSILALRSDGTVASWNTWQDKQRSEFVDAISNVVAVSAGREHHTVLKADGAILTWDPDLNREYPNPEGLKKVIAIASGDSHILALQEDGTLLQWRGWLPDIEFVPTSEKRVIAISCDADDSLALLEDGSILAWNKDGLTDTPTDLPPLRSIASGYNYSLGLTHSGRLVSWGSEALSNVHREKNVVAIKAADREAFAFYADGSVKTLKASLYNGGTEIEKLEDISDIFPGPSCSIVLQNVNGPKFIPQFGIIATPESAYQSIEYQIPSGRHYRILRSTDLKTWNPAHDTADLQLSLGEPLIFSLDSPNQFFQLIAP